jgi:hypothetical protein
MWPKTCPVFNQNYKLHLPVNNSTWFTEVTLRIHLRCNVGLQEDKYGTVWTAVKSTTHMKLQVTGIQAIVLYSTTLSALSITQKYQMNLITNYPWRFNLHTVQYYTASRIMHGSFLSGTEDVWTNCLV